MFYTLSSRLLVPPNTIFVTDHTTGYFVNVLPDWLIVILSLECYIVICIDWIYSYFTALCFSHVEVRFDISVIKELIERIDWLHLHQSQIQFFSGGREGPPRFPAKLACTAQVSPVFRVPYFQIPGSVIAVLSTFGLYRFLVANCRNSLL